MVFIAYGLFVVYCEIVRPESPGVTVDFVPGQTRITHVRAGSPADRAGIQPNDQLLTVNGYPIRDLAGWSALEVHLDFDRSWRMRVDRGGGIVEGTLTFSRQEASFFRTQAGAVLLVVRFVLLTTLALGVLVALRRPFDPVALLGGWLLASVGVFSFVLPYRIGALWSGLPAPIGWALWLPYFSAWAIGGLLCLFFLNFPRPVFAPRRQAAFVVLPMIVALAAYAPSALRMVYAAGRGVSDPPWAFPMVLAVNIGYIALALSVLLRTYARLKDVNERRRIRVLAFGTICGWVSGVMFVLGVWLRRDDPAQLLFASTPASLGALVFLGFPASFAYAILRHRIFDLRVIVRASVRYMLARRTLLSIAPVAAALVAVDVIRASDRTLREIASDRWPMYAALVGVAALAYVQRQRWIDALDRRFFRERYDARRILARLVAEIRDAGRFDAVVKRAVDEIGAALHPQYAAVYVAGPGEREFRAIAAARAESLLRPLPREATIVRLARVLNRPLDVGLGAVEWLRAQLPAAELDRLAEMRIDLLVPLSLGGRAEALLVLGPKRSLEPYGAEDRELLSDIASALALVFRRESMAITAPALAEDTPTIRGLMAAPMSGPAYECPLCGTCYDFGTLHCDTDGAALVPMPVPLVMADRYRLQRCLGRGGMGAVYAALDVALDRAVAAKIMREEWHRQPGAVERFQREAKFAAQFAHPHVVTIHDFGVTADNIAYLIMELLEGESLREEFERNAPLTPARTLAVMRDVASAVDAAHARRLIHRDLKPENIFIVRSDDGAPRGKVLDFGIAKSLTAPGDERTLTQTAPGLVIGTRLYMAPEQLRGSTASRGWDLWSLGVIACELLTGRHPLLGLAVGDIGLYEAAIAAHVAPLSPPLRTFFARSLAIDPAERPDSSQAWIAEFTAAVTGNSSGVVESSRG